MDVDVLVVGAGPTGLMVAAELARHGLRPRLVEAKPEPSPHSKALAVHARTLEICAGAGISDDRVVFDPGFGFGKTPARTGYSWNW